MEANKILSANILDLIFDDRNKDYGAYELRVTYPRRIKRSLLITATVAGVIFTTALLANSAKNDNKRRLDVDSVVIVEIPPDEKIPEPLPEPERQPERQQETVRFTTPVIAPEVDETPPTQDDIDDAVVDVKNQEGDPDDDIVSPIETLGDGKGIIEPPKEVEPEIVSNVQIPARYDGNWARFLTTNLRADVPVENGAAPGRYNVLIQFVVDKEGKVSDLKALTSHGFGMEDEAMRVLEKAKGWKPGIQNGREVKCYHRQPITFVVEE